MKIRTGFVSNSSSSSFIIARAQVGSEKFEAVKRYIADNGSYITGENANYIFVDTSDIGFDEENLEALGIGKDDYMMYYE